MGEMLDTRVNETLVAIAEAKASRDSDTKSSAGDKYETGRAMIQMEIEKNESLLSKIVNMKAEFDQIKTDLKPKKADFGSLVVTNHETYLIAVSMGMLKVDAESVYAISLASPIGLILHNKEVGNKFEFRGRDYKILEIA